MLTEGRSVLNHRITLAVLSLCASLAIAPIAAHADADKTVTADSGLVNISTPDITAPKQWNAKADLRVFGGDENTTYVGVGASYGLSNNWQVSLGSSLAQFENYALGSGAVARHGGTDVELAVKYSTRHFAKFGLSGQLGVGLPNTPAQTSAHITLGAAGSYFAASNVELYVNPRSVLIDSNSIVGLGMGAKIKLNSQFSVVGDYTPILTGSNTIDTTRGTQRSHDIYGAALRYASSSNSLSIDLGYTNGTGFTTGSSLTPGLGGSGAFYLAVTMTR